MMKKIQMTIILLVSFAMIVGAALEHAGASEALNWKPVGAKNTEGAGTPQAMKWKPLTGVAAWTEPGPGVGRLIFFNPETGKKAIMEFVWVPGGSYKMGCGNWTDHCDDDEKPVHEVCVDGFWMGKYEVTQGQWKAVMGENPSRFKKGDNYPVEEVSWYDAQEFFKKLNAMFGARGKFRLPTEAEWEYACRSGGREEKYCGGDDLDRLAWRYGNSGEHTHPVGTREPNGLGIYDMSGNVWEWCSDWYDKNYYKKSPRKNPKGPESGDYRVLRGASWYSSGTRRFRGGYRRSFPQHRHNFNVGLRSARIK